jgi:dTMP kinase
MSLFITFEGIEGCGKTTQIRLLAESLRARGLQVLATREPGGCPIADAIRSILLDSANSRMAPRTELLLYAAARAQHVFEVISPALTEGKAVLCDRFTDATVAYQGYGRHLDRDLIEQLNRLAAEDVVPDLTLLLDFPPEEGLRRACLRNESLPELNEDRFEQESLDFHRRVRAGYLDAAAREERFRIIDARGTVAEVAARVEMTVAEFLRQKERA